MTDAQQREAARQFYYRWNGKGKEDEHARSYWIELLHDVLGVEDVTQRVEFEKKLIGSKGSTERARQVDCPVKLCRDLDLRFGCEEAGTGKNDAGRAAGEVSFLCQYSKK